LPLSPYAAEVDGVTKSKDLMRSSTIWMTAWNLKDTTLNYNTQQKKRVRQLDIKDIDLIKIGTLP
jgi:hypothetical protein